MVSPIDAVQCGVGFDDVGRWCEVNVQFMPAQRKYGEEDPIAAARGALVGLFASGVLWVGLFVAGHALLRLL